MKNLFSLLFVALLTMSAWAETTVTFTAGTDLGLTTANNSPDEVSKDGITIACDNAAFATAQYRFYAGSTATITSTIGNITKVEFTCTGNNTSDNGPGHFDAVSAGAYAYDAKVGTWTGNVAEFTIHANKQVRATKIVVTVGGEAPVETLQAPVFDPADGATFSGESMQVSLSCATENANIQWFYGTPDAPESQYYYYQEPFNVYETCTLTAYSYKGTDMSDYVTVHYTKVEPAQETTEISFVALTDTVEGGTTAGWHSIVKDGVTMKFYGTVSNYTLTDSLGNVTSEYHEYRIHKNQSIQFTTKVGNIRKIEFFTDEINNPDSYGPNGFGNVTGLTVSENGYNAVWEGFTRDITFPTTQHQVRAAQIIVTVDDQIPTITLEVPVISPESCTFTGTQEVTITCETEGATILYSINDADYQEYNAPFILNETATVKAYAELEGETSAVVEATYTKRAEVATLADANALPNKTDFVFYGNVVTVYQNGSNLWVKDDSGYGLIYGSQVPKNIPDGSTLKEEWDAQYYFFRGAINEYQYPNNVVVDEEEPLVEIVPNEYTSDQITTEKINERVILKGLTLLAGPDKYLYNSTDSLTIYNQFGITLPTELEGKTYDVEGMVSYYDNKVQVMPIAITEVQATEYIRGDVDDNGEVKIADVTALINYLLSGDTSNVNLQGADCDQNGEVKIADVTALINYLLSGVWAD